MYRVIKNFKVFKFESYAEAKQFKLENGGTMYVKAYYG